MAIDKETMAVAQVFEVHDELMLEYLVINELIVLV